VPLPLQFLLQNKRKSISLILSAKINEQIKKVYKKDEKKAAAAINAAQAVFAAGGTTASAHAAGKA
jgi:hypothetical protein